MNGNNIMNNNINSQVGNNMMTGNNAASPTYNQPINYNQSINVSPQSIQPNTNVSEPMSKEEINAEISKINAERNKIAGDLQQALSYLQERGIGLNDKIEDVDEDEDEDDEDYESFDMTDDSEVETNSTDNFIEESDEPQNFDIF